MSRPRLRRTGLVTAVALLAVLAGAIGYLVTLDVRGPSRPRSAAPAAYREAGRAAPAVGGGGAGTEPSAGGLRAALARVVTARGLGGDLHAQVVDAATGAVLYDRDSGVAGAPASTAKLLTATAVLALRRPTDRIATTAVAGSGGAVVLVGGGDPTITGARPGQPGAYPDAARLSTLAAQVRRAGVRPTRIVVDDALFTGPTISPAWAGDDVPSSYGSGITALLADGGRATPGAVVRSAAPDLAAGHEFAALLGRPSLPVVRGGAAAGARVLGRVRSAPIGVLVEQMLHDSDNVIAECLGRLVAVALHQPATFTGAAAAIRAELRRLGVDVGDGMVDASGLAASDRLTPVTLARTVRLDVERPRLRPVLPALPTAAWSGTLEQRYLTGPAASAAGVVRAKTGTLTGVSTLAGLVHDRSGRLLVIALMADRTRSTPAAETALDDIAARVAGCGCG